MTDSPELPINEDYVLVEDNDTLDALCRAWRECDYLAMDTEFIRTSTFYPKAGLIQINPGDGNNYLVDPLVMTDWTAFKALMQDAGIVKIFHSCSEDLQVFLAEMQLLPSPLFDTQIAGALLKDGFGCSYQTLVREYTGLDLPKGETRSDWLQRPLAEKQLHYAALDVACLPIIYQAQRKALIDSGRSSWLDEECDALLAGCRTEMVADFSDYYLNIRGAWALNRRQLLTLKVLAEWREHRARKRNRPRNWIVQDKQLIDIARLQPETEDDLAQVKDLGRNFLRHEGREVLDKIREADALATGELPPALPRPLDGRAKQRLKRGQRFVEQQAAALELPVEMLSRKRWLMSALQNMMAAEQDGDLDDAGLAAMLPVEMSGWRKSLLVPGLLEAMKKQ